MITKTLLRPQVAIDDCGKNNITQPFKLQFIVNSYIYCLNGVDTLY